jgi:8-oxo-dGTP diphosphatase
MFPIRVSAKAVIIRHGSLLAIQKQDRWGAYYLLPGGGQEFGESLYQAIRRECLEETGLEVVPGDLLFVRDYIGRNHEFAREDGNMHQLELMFACQIEGDALPGMGPAPDVDQTAVVWLPLEELEKYRLYPKALIARLQQLSADHHPVYLGDVN